MRYWLFKSEPGTYSLADLKRDGRTTWDGITNAMARIHLRAIEPGDRILFYHTGDEKAVVGEMKAVSGPRPEPESDDPKAVVVTVEYFETFSKPVTLSTIRKDKAFSQWDLVRNSRLSVMPVTEKQWRRIQQLSGE